MQMMIDYVLISRCRQTRHLC